MHIPTDYLEAVKPGLHENVQRFITAEVERRKLATKKKAKKKVSSARIP